MQKSLFVWIIGSLALLATTANEVLNGIVAFGTVADTDLILALRVLFLVAFGLTIVGVISLTYFTGLFQYNVNNQGLTTKHSVWLVYGMGVLMATTGLALSGVAVIWAIIKRSTLPRMILYRSPSIWLYIWSALWGASLLLQLAFFTTLGLRTRQILRNHAGRTRSHQTTINKQSSLMVDTTRGRSLISRETTSPSFPPSPSTNATSSLRASSSAKTLTAANSRTKLIGKSSSRSSFDQPIPTPGETLTMDAFAQWDTSSVHHELRAAVGSSAAVPKVSTVLDTIPGSRPDSPANALGIAFEPMSTPVRVISADASSTYEISSPVSHYQTPHRLPSSPPSSPPNFSRPTSKSKIRLFAGSTDTTREQHVHPLFRSTSPHPPPIATMGTTVTVSDPHEPITPKSLARLRNSSVQERGLRGLVSSASKGHRRAMPSADATSTRPSTAGSSGFGSPGPSIADEDDLPPILPGFVLGAGSRSSLIGYSSRKSSRKDKRSSRLSYIE